MEGLNKNARTSLLVSCLKKRKRVAELFINCTLVITLFQLVNIYLC